MSLSIDDSVIKNFSSDFLALENEIGKSIIGQKEIVRSVLISMISGGNVLLEGLPGLGKTQLVKAVATVLDMKFSRIQFTPDLMPSDVTGTDVIVKLPDGNNGFKFQKGPIFANIVLADEINRATPKTQSALLEAMQEGTVTVGPATYELPVPFFVLATQNPLEMEGTYPLPEAQMDRFLFKLDVKFPNKSELMDIVDLTTGLANIKPKKIFDGEKILEMRSVARQTPVSRAVFEFISDLILKTHPDYEGSPEMVKKYVRYGASPRGAQALLNTSRVLALLEGRYNVSFDDIKKLAHPVLRHRLFLNFEALADGVTENEIITELISGGVN